jgi:hypothetical protein
VLEETGIVARPRAARIDKRGASAASETERIDPKRRAAPIDVGVQVDKARRDDEAVDVVDRCAGKIWTDFGDAAILEANVRDGIDTL